MLAHLETDTELLGDLPDQKLGGETAVLRSALSDRNARHLFDPAGLIYCATMEEGLYEIDVKTLAVTELWADEQKKTGEVFGQLTKDMFSMGSGMA